MLKRGTFSVPVDTSDTLLRKSFSFYGGKFVEAENKRDWGLRSDLRFIPHLAADRHEPERKHWVMLGDFTPRFNEKEIFYEDVSDATIKKLRRKHGRKVRIV